MNDQEAIAADNHPTGLMLFERYWVNYQAYKPAGMIDRRKAMALEEKLL